MAEGHTLIVNYQLSILNLFSSLNRNLILCKGNETEPKGERKEPHPNRLRRLAAKREFSEQAANRIRRGGL